MKVLLSHVLEVVLENRKNINSIPHDIKTYLFSYFDAETLVKLIFVSKEFRMICEQPSLWKSLWERDKQKWNRLENDVFYKNNIKEGKKISAAINTWDFFSNQTSQNSNECWKRAYLKLHNQNCCCSPSKENGLFSSVRSRIKTQFGKIHTVPMFGEGLEGGASKGLLYELMYNEESPFKMTGLHPGVEGLGSGVGFTINDIKLNLSAMYRYEDRGVFDRIRPLWLEFFKTASGFVFVVDMNQSIESSAADLFSFMDEVFSVAVDAPLLVLVCGNQSIPLWEIAEGLGLSEGKMKFRKWCVKSIAHERIGGIWDGLAWLTSKIV